tara:strand:- start:8569 stop:9822 length:1254 start_codon:yes stop_codon:yes gene_type:complete
MFNKDLFGDDAAPEKHGSVLAETWDYPPFSVLSARDGWWQSRKREWLALGIRSELGRGSGTDSPGGSDRPACDYSDGARGDGAGRKIKADARTFGQDIMRGEHKVGDGKAAKIQLVPGGAGKNSAWTGTGPTQNVDPKSVRLGDFAGGTPDTVRDAGFYSRKRRAEKDAGRELSIDEFRTVEAAGTEETSSGTSIFDPVVCELAYRWFSPAGGVVLDPFAGGSVRGVVASVLGRAYHGIELRPEQVEANRAQAHLAKTPAPIWHCGDSKDAAAMISVAPDMIFSCPPYADLEVYSDDPRDISRMSYPDFLDAYREIIAESCKLLRDDSFACFVVGEIRDKKGNYRNFVGDTVSAFQAAGLNFYNEAILVTAVGSLPVRTGKQFKASRKLGKTHQNILVFVKGDGKRAAARCAAGVDQ